MIILLVEDNNETRSMFKDLLEDRGHKVSAFAAVEHVIEWKPFGQEDVSSRFDAVITDFNMPGMNGLELLNRIDSWKVPKFMCSACIEEEVPLKAKALGAQFFDKMEFRKILDILSLKA